MEMIICRSVMISTIRAFFLSRGFLEVDTPVLSPALIPEAAIEPFVTQYKSHIRPSREMYLLPSPELYIKKFIAKTGKSVFQIAKTFRNMEQIGPIHNPEFTMLEWYGAGISYQENIPITLELIRKIVDKLPENMVPAEIKNQVVQEPLILTMQQAFKRYAGINLQMHLQSGTLSEIGGSLGKDADSTESPDDLFNRLFLNLVEPELPADRLVFLTDYPALVPCLAQKKPETPWNERWELYAGGMELSNCFTEETGWEEVKEYFNSESKKTSAISRKADADLPSLYKHGTQQSFSGNAMGLERLLMYLTGTENIEGVILFPFSDILAYQ